jgi:hypothetical protein
MTELTKEIRKQVAQYVAGDLEPNDFRDWFALQLRDVHKMNDPEAEELVHSIEWEFLDVERGISTEQVARQNLLQIAVSEVRTVVVFGAPMVWGGVSYVPIETSGTSSRLQPGVAAVPLGQPQILRETVSA